MMKKGRPGTGPRKRTARSGYVEGATHLTRGLRIVHEDEAILVIDKPAGMLTAGLGGPGDDSAFAVLKSHVREQARKRGTKLWIVHRLDREASGLLVFAKTETAYEHLKEEFRSKKAHRLYAAAVEGEFGGSGPASTGTVQSFLWEDSRGIMHSIDSPTQLRDTPARGSAPMPAVTHYRVRKTAHGRSLINVRLETGRKNQIRVHMQHIGRPIVGDRRYGASTDPLGRVCLHACELGFTHPQTRHPVRYSSLPPDEFTKLLGRGAGDALAPAAAPVVPASTKVTSWDEVAGWYDQLLEDRGSDHYEQVILPGVMHLLAPKSGHRVLDIACGQGILARRLVKAGATCVGVDSSPRLITRAKELGEDGCEFHVGDARELGSLGLTGEFDSAACVMALMNIEPMAPVVNASAALLKPGGVFVCVILHPAFRSPGRTSWHFEGAPAPRPPRGMERGPSRPRPPSEERITRRVDAYLSSDASKIVMNPGEAAHGKPEVVTMTYHRPIQDYVSTLADAGLHLTALEEWVSNRSSQPGPRAVEENRARREIPMFLALRAVRAGPFA